MMRKIACRNLLCRWLCLATLAGSFLCGFSQTFTEGSTGVVNLTQGSFCWADLDSDGDFDLGIMGKQDDLKKFFFYKNNRVINIASWSVSGNVLGLIDGKIVFDDFNNDNLLDLAITGSTDEGTTYQTMLYVNSGSSTVPEFTKVTGITLPGVANKGNLQFFDADNDGDKDLLIAGWGTNGEYLMKLYKNTSGSFSKDSVLVFEPATSAIACDFDNDDDFDIIVAGNIIDNNSNTLIIYVNDGKGNFTPQTIFTNKPNLSSLSPFDYNSDGKLDLVWGGWGIYLTKHPYNKVDTIGQDLAYEGQYALGDIDNNGKIDILNSSDYRISYDSWVRRTALFMNKSTTTTNSFDTLANFPDLQFSATDLAMLNLYGVSGKTGNNMDICMMARGNEFSGFTDNTFKVLHNNTTADNAPPSAPAGLGYEQTVTNDVRLSWSAATDDKTPPISLSYNLWVKNAQGAFIMSPMANLDNGFRKITGRGNVELNTSWTLRNLEPGFYTWGVQAIDHQHAGSSFATSSFVFGDIVLQIDVLNDLVNQQDTVCGLNVNFKGDANPNDVKLWLWDFGDG